jgi:hypothetical protein
MRLVVHLGLIGVVVDYPDPSKTGHPRKAFDKRPFRIEVKWHIAVLRWVIRSDPSGNRWTNPEARSALIRMLPIRVVVPQHDVANQVQVTGRTRLNGSVQSKEESIINQFSSYTESKGRAIGHKSPTRVR